jgi:hypothetical protein
MFLDRQESGSFRVASEVEAVIRESVASGAIQFALKMGENSEVLWQVQGG